MSAEFLEGGGRLRPEGGREFQCLRASPVGRHLVTRAEEPCHHVPAHLPETDKTDPHRHDLLITLQGSHDPFRQIRHPLQARSRFSHVRP